MTEKIKTDVAWIGATTMEETIRNAFKVGTERALIPLLQALMEPKRSEYREIWKQEVEKRKAKSNA